MWGQLWASTLIVWTGLRFRHAKTSCKGKLQVEFESMRPCRVVRRVLAKAIENATGMLHHPLPILHL